MRRLVVVVVGGVLFALLIGGTASFGDDPVTFQVNLHGAQEVPGPGDPDGEGGAFLHINADHGQLCYSIKVQKIALPSTGTHIHLGDKGKAGPVVIGLKPPDENGRSDGCVDADPQLLRAILANPVAYYLNVHNQEYPAGAVRGQLGNPK